MKSYHLSRIIFGMYSVLAGMGVRCQRGVRDVGPQAPLIAGVARRGLRYQQLPALAVDSGGGRSGPESVHQIYSHTTIQKRRELLLPHSKAPMALGSRVWREMGLFLACLLLIFKPGHHAAFPVALLFLLLLIVQPRQSNVRGKKVRVGTRDGLEQPLRVWIATLDLVAEGQLQLRLRITGVELKRLFQQGSSFVNVARALLAQRSCQGGIVRRVLRSQRERPAVLGFGFGQIAGSKIAIPQRRLDAVQGGVLLG